MTVYAPIHFNLLERQCRSSSCAVDSMEKPQREHHEVCLSSDKELETLTPLLADYATTEV